jgi:hypothetical protein
MYIHNYETIRTEGEKSMGLDITDIFTAAGWNPPVL